MSTSNSIYQMIDQHHTPFVNWCYCGIEVLFEIVCLFVVLKLIKFKCLISKLPCKIAKRNRLNINATEKQNLVIYLYHKSQIQRHCIKQVCVTIVNVNDPTLTLSQTVNWSNGHGPKDSKNTNIF